MLIDNFLASDNIVLEQNSPIVNTGENTTSGHAVMVYQAGLPAYCCTQHNNEEAALSVIRTWVDSSCMSDFR
jgi:hypothetical protein